MTRGMSRQVRACQPAELVDKQALLGLLRHCPLLYTGARIQVGFVEVERL